MTEENPIYDAPLRSSQTHDFHTTQTFFWISPGTQHMHLQHHRGEKQSKSASLQYACVEKPSGLPSEEFCAQVILRLFVYTLLHISTSVLRTTEKLNAEFRSKHRPGIHAPEKKLKVGKNRLDLLPAATTSAACSSRPSHVRVVEIACPFSFSLSSSNLHIVMPRPPFCSSYDNSVG